MNTKWFSNRVLIHSFSPLAFLKLPRRVSSSKSDGTKRGFEDIPPRRIRNFSIIAHVDHGKSTLADRLLEIAGLIRPDSANKQVLDRLDVERERGITVKAQTVSLLWRHRGEDYLVNLIDTPGHVDFSSEVARSLVACQGAVLLVDAKQGVEAQTLANYHLAQASGLTLIPALNKIDLKDATPDAVANQLHSLFDIPLHSILRVSAKVGTGVRELLEAVIERVPPPETDRAAPLRALLFDSWFDKYRGVMGLVYVRDGLLRGGDQVRWCHTGKAYTIATLSILQPHEVAVNSLRGGQVGCISMKMRSIKEAVVGDTLVSASEKDTDRLVSSYRKARPMLYAGLYPLQQADHPKLRAAIERLTLNDNAVTVAIDSSGALGQGWRLGFLGLLHLEVFTQRLHDEYGAQPVLTSPSVTYKVFIQGKKNIDVYGGSEVMVSNPLLLPDEQIITEIQEPVVLGTIITPELYLDEVRGLCSGCRGVEEGEPTPIDHTRIILRWMLPLNEIVIDFHDTLKSITSGFASFDYEERGFLPSNMVKMVVMLNGVEVAELSQLVHSSKARQLGRRICLNLLDILPRQQFQVAIQAKVGGKVIARETLKPYRKDVTAKLYGGDVTRRMKLLKRQSEGKQRMKTVANIAIPRETFIDVLKR